MRYVVGDFNTMDQFYAGASDYFSENYFQSTPKHLKDSYTVIDNMFFLIKGYGKYDVAYSLEGERTNNIVILVGKTLSDVNSKVDQFKNVNAQVILFVPKELLPTNIPHNIKVASSIVELISTANISKGTCSRGVFEQKMLD